MTEDDYTLIAQEALDTLSSSASDVLWNAIIDTLDAVLNDDDLIVRRERLLGGRGQDAWMIRVRGHEAHAVLWSIVGARPVISWVGVWPPV